MPTRDIAAFCEETYHRFHHPFYISPDPLEVVLEYEDHADRELVGFVAACLSVGQVDAIISAIRRIVYAFPSPAIDLMRSSDNDIRGITRGFRYRFFDQRQMEGLLIGLREVLLGHGSIETLARDGTSTAGSDESPATAAVARIVEVLRENARGLLDNSILLTHPADGSACKRMMLFLRWMVRRDLIDPGGWQTLTPADLLVPLDTHMMRICSELGLTSRKTATLSTAREITAAFAGILPDDPVRYDFSLTRLGINPLVRRLPKSGGYGLH